MKTGLKVPQTAVAVRSDVTPPQQQAADPLARPNVTSLKRKRASSVGAAGNRPPVPWAPLPPPRQHTTGRSHVALVQKLPSELQERITAHLDAPSIANFEACCFGPGNRPQLWSHLAAPLMAVLPEKAKKDIFGFLPALHDGIAQAVLEQLDEPARLAILDVVLQMPAGCFIQVQLLDASTLEAMLKRALLSLVAMLAEYPSQIGPRMALQEQVINLARAVECLPKPLPYKMSQASDRALVVLGTLQGILAPQNLTRAQQSALMLPTDLLEQMPMAMRARLRAYLQPIVPWWVPVYGQVLDLDDWWVIVEHLYNIATKAVREGSEAAMDDLDEQLQKYENTCARLNDVSSRWLKHSVELVSDALTDISAAVRQGAHSTDPWARRSRALSRLKIFEDRSKQAFKATLYAYHLDAGG